MFNHPVTQVLSLMWRLLTVLIIPIIIYLYVAVMDYYNGNFSFADLDQGKNIHKWIVFAIYLACILCWNRLNPYFNSTLKKMEY